MRRRGQALRCSLGKVLIFPVIAQLIPEFYTGNRVMFKLVSALLVLL
jgi:hypothetical protein